MQVAKDKVVYIHYTLTNHEGEVLDSSRGAEPLAYLHGANNIIPGLEKALEGRKAGDSFQVSIAPEDAYGEFNPELIRVVPLSMFAGVERVEPGMQFQAETTAGVQVFRIAAVDGDDVTIDANHPLAGQHLSFDIEITEVRDASPDELDHGHVHGPGGSH